MRGEPATVCRHVLEGAPILFAARDEPGEPPGCEWRFLCGAMLHGAEDGRPIALDEVVRRDPSAVEIVLHPRSTTLERSGAEGRWQTGAGPVLLPHRASRRYPRFEPRFPPRPGEALDGEDLRLMADVAQHGFHVAAVAGEGDARAHAHSVGLFRSWDHPEVAAFGLAPEVLHAAVARLGDRVRRGERFDHGDVAEGVLHDRAVAFRRIVPRHYAAFLARAVWYHDGARFPALQALWADADGRFPWDRWFPRELRDLQPVLFEPEPA
ncbi:MAG TPA: DUF4262 domain-containing protein [Anaeromyxobacter sp.]|nr:DUF4262 domain-containing protein [Anaeromyxobacter sp.]